MGTLAILPARYGSTRFPGKPLHRLLDKPLIIWTAQHTLETGLFDKVVVATDDQRIFDLVSSYDIDVVMTQSTHISGTDRVAEVSRLFPEFEFVFNIQGDEPLVHRKILEPLLVSLKNGSDIVTAARSINEDEAQDKNIVKVVWKHSTNQAMYFSRSPIPFHRDSSLPVRYWGHIGLYGFKQNILQSISKLTPSPLEVREKLEQLRWLENNLNIIVSAVDYQPLGLDHPSQVEEIELALKERYK